MINASFADKGIANFVSNNLVYTDADNHQTVEWSINLDAIINNLDHITGYPTDLPSKYDGLAYFLNGSLSVQYPDSIYTDAFPNARVAEIEGAGHYLHIDKG